LREGGREHALHAKRADSLTRRIRRWKIKLVRGKFKGWRQGFGFVGATVRGKRHIRYLPSDRVTGQGVEKTEGSIGREKEERCEQAGGEEMLEA